MTIKEWLESIEERFERGINRDESVVFYPSYGFIDVDGEWKIEVRGIIFEERELLKHIPRLALTLAGVSSAGKLAKLLDDFAEDIDTVQYFKERSKRMPKYMRTCTLARNFQMDLSLRPTVTES